MKRPFALLVLFFILLSVEPAAESAMSVKARAWPKTVTVGDEIRVLVQVTRLQGFIVKPPSSVDLSPFELKSFRELPSVEEEGISQENFEYLVTIFKVGEFKIPPMQVFFTDPTGESGSLSTPPIPIKVVGVVPARGGSASGGKDSALDIRPIKNVISLDPGLLRSLILGGLALVLSLALGAWNLLRRKKKIAVDPEALLPAHERAVLELGRLEKKDWISAGRFKEYYSELSSILKRYVERRFEVGTADLTTSEIGVLLKDRNFELSVRGGIREILEASDLVKFANWVPPKDLSVQLVKKISDVIERTKLVPVPEDPKA